MASKSHLTPGVKGQVTSYTLMGPRTRTWQAVSNQGSSGLAWPIWPVSPGLLPAWAQTKEDGQWQPRLWKGSSFEWQLRLSSNTHLCKYKCVTEYIMLSILNWPSIEWLLEDKEQSHKDQQKIFWKKSPTNICFKICNVANIFAHD